MYNVRHKIKISGCRSVRTDGVFWKHEDAGSNPAIPGGFEYSEKVIKKEMSCGVVDSTPGREAKVRILAGYGAISSTLIPDK